MGYDNRTFEEKYIREHGAGGKKATEYECGVLSRIARGDRRRSTVYLWEMEGSLELSEYVANYKALMGKFPEFITTYYKGTESYMKVVEQGEVSPFPIYDVSPLPRNKMDSLINNVLAAECRRIYDPTEDKPIRIQCFSKGKDSIYVVFSIYPYFNYSITVRELRNSIFRKTVMLSEKTMDATVDNIENLNNEMMNRCRKHWRQELSEPCGKLVFPKQKDAPRTRLSINTKAIILEPELNEQLINYSSQVGVERQYLIFSVLADILGEYNKEKNPIFAVILQGEGTNVAPVKVKRTLSLIERYQDVKRQMEEFVRFSSCTTKNICDWVGIKEHNFFDIVFSVNAASAKSSFMGNCVKVGFDTEPAMEIDVDVQNNDTVVSFKYKTELLDTEDLEVFCDTFVKILGENLKRKENKEFSWKDYVAKAATAEEKYKKVEEAKKALAFMKAGLTIEKQSENVIPYLSSVVTRIYSEGDTIVSSGINKNAIGIIESGNVEEIATDSNGMVKPLAVYKSGHMVGVDSLCGKKPEFACVAVSDEVRVYWIQADVLKEYIETCPQLWMSLLNVILSETDRFKKLWTLQ